MIGFFQYSGLFCIYIAPVVHEEKKEFLKRLQNLDLSPNFWNWNNINLQCSARMEQSLSIKVQRKTCKISCLLMIISFVENVITKIK